MRIAVLSDTVMPTPTPGGHGLGRAVYNLSREMLLRGHEVTLYGAEGSLLPGGRVDIHQDHGPSGEVQLAMRVMRKAAQYDAFVDAGHQHALAQMAAGVLRGLAYFQDTASKPAPCPVYVSYQCRSLYHAPGPVVENGVVPAEFPFYDGPRAGLLWLAYNIDRKRLPDAAWVARQVGLPLAVYGLGTPNGAVMGEDKVRAFQQAAALLFPSVLDAGPQTPLEAMCCGTPVLAYYGTGAQEYVEHGVGGYLCRDRAEMAARVADALALEPARVRASVLDRRLTCARQAEQLEFWLQQAIEGVRW